MNMSKQLIDLEDMIRLLKQEFSYKIFNGHPVEPPKEFIFIEVDEITKVLSDNLVHSMEIEYSVFFIIKQPMIDFTFLSRLPWLTFIENQGYNANYENYVYRFSFFTKIYHEKRVDMRGESHG